MIRNKKGSNYLKEIDKDIQNNTMLENRFITILEQHHIETWMYDISRHTIIQNHNTNSIYGFQDKEIPDVPESLISSKLCHPDDCKGLREFYDQLHQGAQQVTGVFRVLDRFSNTYVWKRSAYTVLPDKEGEHTYALGSSVDVTEQMEAKQKYEAAMKSRYNKLAENVIIVGHCNVTRNVILEVEDRTGLDIEHQFGMVREDFFRGLSSLIPNEVQQQIFCNTFLNDNIKNSFELGITQHNYECTFNLGSEKGICWISTHIDAALQPETNELIGFLTVTDISASKMQEQVLDAVIQFNYDYVAHLNLHTDTTVFYKSKKQSKQLMEYQYAVPYSYSKAIKHTAELYIVEEEKEYYEENMSIHNVLNQLQDKDSFEFIYHLKDENGDIRMKQARIAMRDRENGIAVFSRADVTDLLTQQEEQKIALTESLSIAQQANNSKSRFLASMSHDIRTPMNAIIGMCSLAIADESDLKQVHESLEVIQQSSELLLSMINDILDMNRIESGKMVLTSEPFSIGEQLQIAGKRACILAAKKNQTIKLFHDVVHDTCKGDVVRIHRAIDNILSNALKFTPEGGTITYGITESQLENKKFALYHFEITDTGIGISTEQQENIFEPFYRVQNSMTSKVEGAGLGLSIVKSILDYMGGSISVKSTVNKGTTFTIDLPLLIADELPRVNKKTKNKSFHLSGLHVLICEDHPINQLVAKRMLEKEGMIVTLANNGEEGYKEFIHSPIGFFDAILMDVQMPVMNGYEATRAIRGSDHTQAKNIPIIAMTANAFAEDIKKSMEAGMNDHLAKPIEPKQLYDALAEFILIN